MGTSNTLKTEVKTCLFIIKNGEVWEKYEDIWYVIENKLDIKFHSMPAYDEKYIKTKVREFDGKVKTKFWGSGVTKENIHYTCVTCITIDSVMRIDKKKSSTSLLRRV